MWLKENQVHHPDDDVLAPTVLLVAIFIGFKIARYAGGRAGGVEGWIVGSLFYLGSMALIWGWHKRWMGEGHKVNREDSSFSS